MTNSSVHHQRLSCGIDLAVWPLPGRSIAALEIRLLAGYAFEDPQFLGVTNVLEEAITKGTEKRTGQELSDAFDEIGASHSSFAGRETVGFSCQCLAEYLERAIELHAELLRTPTFPQDACEVAVELTSQSLSALEDDPQELVRKLLLRQAYGDPLGRHVLGEPETLERITRDAVVAHWRRFFGASRMMVGVAGAVDPARVADWLERHFAGFEAGESPSTNGFSIAFGPGHSHFQKDLEQEQVGICFPGAAVTDPDYSVEQVTVGVLSGGMSGRLFTEVREKQGLVYWVGAWTDQPRRGGMVHLGASSTPENVEKTYTTLLRELDRLGEDVTPAEIDRAIVGIEARTQTQGEVTRSKANELVNDLFYWGRPIPTEEKLARVRAVRVDDVRRYMADHKRDRLSIVTVGPQPLHVDTPG